jgi:hypothetical protein
MTTDPIWFRILQLIIPSFVAGAAALGGAVLANRFAEVRAEREFRDRALERQQRMLGPLFAPMLAAYSDIYASILGFQEGLSRFTKTRDRADLPSAAVLGRTLRDRAIWLTPAAGEALFDMAQLAYKFCDHPETDVASLIASITSSLQTIRAALGVDRFHDTWMSTLSGER